MNVSGGGSFDGAEAIDTRLRADDLPDGGLNPNATFVGRGCTVMGGDTMPAAPADDGDPSRDEIAVMVRGLCTFGEKVDAAKGAGCDGWIIYNDRCAPRFSGSRTFACA